MNIYVQNVCILPYLYHLIPGTGRRYRLAAYSMCFIHAPNSCVHDIGPANMTSAQLKSAWLSLVWQPLLIDPAACTNPLFNGGGLGSTLLSGRHTPLFTAELRS